MPEASGALSVPPKRQWPDKEKANTLFKNERATQSVIKEMCVCVCVYNVRI